MTNEEIIEGLLYKAHQKGFYDKMMEKVLNYKVNNSSSNLNPHNYFIIAYTECNQEYDEQKIVK
jgi:hypothetical protein